MFAEELALQFGVANAYLGTLPLAANGLYLGDYDESTMVVLSRATANILSYLEPV